MLHNIFVFLLCVCVVIIQGNVQYQQPYITYYNGLYPYPNYAMMADSMQPSMKLVPENRFFWTWTSTTTSTSTTTCTVSANAACPRRRKRFLIDDSEDDIIDPSSIENRVVATQIDDDSRKTREAQPQLDFQSYELVQSTFSKPYISPDYNLYLRQQQPILAVNPRLFIRFTTSTVTEVSTSTSRPACFSPSGFNKC
uniref:Uncharacterized protein n=1 Tax=Daphnia galeata TaxID=27404 RepID=A0A8J2RWQ4_9CRUS|nr:unnamed protein product [Daphnia galeata]